MSDIFREVDEEVQREKVETLWSRYQTPVFVIAGLIVAATGAWNYYTNEKTKAAEAANVRFMAAVALADAGKSADAIAAFDAMAKDAPKGYATIAKLRAAEELGKTDKAKAIEALDAIADDAGVDHLTQEVARMRGAVYTMEAGDSEKSMLKLGPLMTSKGVFRFSAQEWTGLDALRAVRFSEVVVLLVDSTIPFEKQDLTIADIAASEGRAVVIGLGKWDLIEDRGKTLIRLREEAERLLAQIRGCPVIPVSGATGEGLDELMRAVIGVHETWNKRISTARLNRWLINTIEQNPPPAVSGRRIKIRYMTQPKSRPPHFVLFGNQLDELPTSYERFLINGLRKTFDFPGVPLRISRKTADNPYEGKKRG